MNIVAMSAHPDDMELEAGGTLSKCSMKNYSVYHIVLTTSSISNFRKEEALDAASQLGIKEVIFLDYKDTELKCTGESISRVDDIIGDLKPDTFISHHPFDSHQDHKAAADILFSVSRHGNIKNVLSGSPLPYRPNVFSFRPQLFVDITDTIESKIASIRAHKSQYQKYGSEKLIDRIYAMAAYYGWAVDYDYAECFEVIKMSDGLCL
ncbi:hypothetical protein HNV12_07895 [Methanococcoides sp. SA1]|nr:hypothetical protein [Methanococcoides sp. SA1]